VLAVSAIFDPVKTGALQIIHCVSLSSSVRICEMTASAPRAPINFAAFLALNTKP
jgi:hypothetical protein